MKQVIPSNPVAAEPDLLSAARIRMALGGAAAALGIECVDQIDSTNAALLQRLPVLDSPLLLAAEAQSAGRGRAGRAWLTAAGGSLAFSLAWPFFRREVAGLAGLPLAVGVALARALHESGVAVRLKWPNDLLLDGGKLGGVLVETGHVERVGHRQLWAVIGVGINIALPDALASQLDSGISQARVLFGQRNEFLATAATHLGQVLAQFDSQGFAPFMQDWNRLHAHAGATVRILDQGRVQSEGVAQGVDAGGALLLETPAGLQSVHAGDVSLRLHRES
jgi:BirA family biotin operon repressor/biotin-[acetyl-CoA-carboxylase] ligase